MWSINLFVWQLSSDQMYLTAIRNLANTSSDSNTPTDIHDATVSSTGIEEGLANTFSCEKAKRMLYCVRKTEMAIAAARWIAQKLPLGTYFLKGGFANDSGRLRNGIAPVPGSGIRNTITLRWSSVTI